MFEYIDGAAEDERTMARNTEAFDDYDLIPRYLVDVERVDTTATVLGADLEWPVLVAPTGMSRLFHHLGETAVVRAARSAGTLYSLSTLSSVSIEDVGRETDGPKMFQIYVLREPELNDQFIERCRETGYRALCLTIDVPVAGNRERDFRTGMTIPPSFGLRQLLDIARHPAWVWNHLTHPKMTLANVADRIDQGSRDVSTLAKYIHDQFDPSVTWERAAEMVRKWDGPFAVKGILCAEDARRAADIGATAVIVRRRSTPSKRWWARSGTARR
jgi:L-lactate dehydrogenase (cytochrome)